MSLRTWLLFLTMETALSLSPGPAVIYVVAQGVRSFSRAVPATLGILSANATYFALSGTSIGMLLAGSARVFAVAKWTGAAYLICLGVKSLRAAVYCNPVALDTAGSPALPVRYDRRRVFLGALILQFSNPKALLFFLALLPQFIDTQRPTTPQIVVLAATSVVPEFCILLSYGWLAHRAARASEKFDMAAGLTRSLAWIEGLGLLGCATLVLRYR